MHAADDGDRDRWVAAIHRRIEEAEARDDGAALFSAEADAELRALFLATDPRTDLGARTIAGWLFWGRAAALGQGRGGVEGAAAGMLLFPVWVADPSLVPPELAELFAAGDPGMRPDPSAADGPNEWMAVCLGSVMAARGPDHPAPPVPPDEVDRLRELGAQQAAMGLGPEQLLWSAVGAGTLAWLATSEQDPAYPERLAHLEYARSAAAPEPRDETTLDLAVRLAHHAAKHTPATNPARLRALAELGWWLCRRYEERYDPEDLAEAIGATRDVLEQTPEDHPDRPRFLSDLAYALHLRLRHEGGDRPAYDEVVNLFRAAAPGDPNGPGPAALNVGNALATRYERFHDRRDLQAAIAELTGALAAPGLGPDARAAVRSMLGMLLRTRFLDHGDPADVEAAVAHTTEALAATSEMGPRTVSRLVHAALALRARSDLTGGLDDLERAASLLGRAAAALPAAHPGRPAVLNDLGAALIATFERRTGSRAELTEGVRLLREAVALTPEHHPMLRVRLLNLASMLQLRHNVTGDSADRRESEEHRRRAAELPGYGPADHAAVQVATANTLLAGADREGEADRGAASDEAVERHRAAVRLTPPGDVRLPQRRLRLAAALVYRFAVTGRRADAREAVALADAVRARLPTGSPLLPGALSIAAHARLAAASRTARREAVELLRAAVDATPPGDPRTATRLIALATVLLDRVASRGVFGGLFGGTFRGSSDDVASDDVAEAAEALHAAALERRAPASTRVEAARTLGELLAAHGRWERALRTLTLAVDLLPFVAPRHLERADQEHALSQTAGLGAVAVACAVRCGRPGLAVRLAEQARGVLLGHAFDADSDLTRLRAVAPDLADRFERLRAVLDTATAPEDLDVPAERPRADLRQGVAEEWEELTARIRAEHPELRLFRPVAEWDEDELRATAAEGPVVLVNVSPYGGDALVVTGRRIDAVPLPGLGTDEVARRRETFENALLTLEDPRTGRKDSLAAQQVVRDTLSWLWTAATGPVLAHLRRLGLLGTPAPRVWWSPGGALGTLPLHAAAPADGSPGALDQTVPSYTPTLRALRHARERLARPACPATGPAAGSGAASGSGAGTLVVAVPEPEGLPALPGAHGEAERLRRLLPTATVLSGPAATRPAVEEGLRRHAQVHFACHAVGDLDSPSASRLVLHDHAARPLTVRDLSRLRLPAARLAYLSACATLRTSPELADEAVHIVSACQMAGFPHVVGSLWHVDDTIGARLAEQLYAALRTPDGGIDVSGAARALATAVHALRADYPATPSLWSCPVHAGP